MKATDILKAVGEVDEEVIDNAKKNQKSNKKVLITVGTIAACAVFGCIGVIMLNMPKNNISEPSPNSTGSTNSDTGFDGNWYSSGNESKILTGDYSVPEKSVQEKSLQEFETSFANEGSERELEQIPVEMYKIKDGTLVHDTVMLDASPQTIFDVWKSENYIGSEVQLIGVDIESDSIDTVSEYSGVEVIAHQTGNKTIYTITVTRNLEDYYEIKDFYGYRSKELVLESLEKTMTSICDSKGTKPDEYRLFFVDEILPEESESNRIDPNDIQYNDRGEILE